MSVRFAPSPTGDFHLGNLRTAWISRELARKLQVPWVVRFEDIDLPRVVNGAMEAQLADMRALGLEPDQVLIQSRCYFRHESLFRAAIDEGIVYPCSCSRKEILQHLQEMASAPHFLSADEGPIYDGRCRRSVGGLHFRAARAARAAPAAPAAPAARVDRADRPTIAWRFLNPEDDSGRQDFVVGRIDSENRFQPSYHWACAIDDYEGNHSALVRAWDLSHVIPSQRLVHRWVGDFESRRRAYPAVFHTALVQTGDRRRLEKRTQGVTLKEIIAEGAKPESILESFRRSFDSSVFSEFTPGKIWGEKLKNLPLSAVR